MNWFGIVNLHKPPGMSSRAAVDRVKRLVRPAKLGHAGTLDPLAAGVLLVPLGPATRLVDYLHRFPKSYVAEFRLGATSPTEDTEGEITELVDAPRPTPDQLAAACHRLTGPIEQRPSAFSALRVEGRRAYRLARAGRAFELAPRRVTIHRLEVRKYDYPRLVLEASVSTGTYVRALGRDLAESLGTAAVMTDLLRTSIGPFGLETAVDPGEVTPENLALAVQPARWAVADLEPVACDDEALTRLARGLTVALEPAGPGPEFAALDADGQLRAIVVRRAGGIGPRLNFRLDP